MSKLGKKLIAAAKNNRTRDDAEQSQRFIEAAKELEADETKEGAERAFKQVVNLPKKNARHK